MLKRLEQAQNDLNRENNEMYDNEAIEMISQIKSRRTAVQDDIYRSCVIKTTRYDIDDIINKFDTTSHELLVDKIESQLVNMTPRQYYDAVRRSMKRYFRHLY